MGKMRKRQQKKTKNKNKQHTNKTQTKQVLVRAGLGRGPKIPVFCFGPLLVSSRGPSILKVRTTPGDDFLHEEDFDRGTVDAKSNGKSRQLDSAGNH